MNASQETNLFKANSVNTEDKPFIKKNILKNVRNQTTGYVNYIKKNIRLVQEDGAMRIPLKKIESRYYVERCEEELTVKKQLFKINLKKVIVNNTTLVTIKSRNKKENFIVLNTKINAKTIAIKLENRNILLKFKPATVYQVELDKLNNKREVEKIKTDLFKEDIYEVFTEKPNVNKNMVSVSIIKSNDDQKTLVLETSEKLNSIYLKENDYELQMQLKAIKTLRDNPRKEHTPLQKLFDPSKNAIRYFEENIEYNNPNLDFEILNNLEIDGVIEQQGFVKKALNTLDFALLEGPPGSGKTTAIIELIIQLIKQDKRILLVSATHVAVDNVIHRILTKYKKQCEGLVVPIRISTNPRNIRKKTVEPYELKTFVNNTKEKIVENLNRKNIKGSGSLLLDSLTNTDKEGESNFDDIILKSANLVAGTMIGILQHPDIRNNKSNISELFDVMIVDESSKVTFPQFIVPALHAKKWILVGDVKQLSPYTDSYFVNENLDTIIKQDNLKNKLVKSYDLNKKLDSTKTHDNQSIKVLFSENHFKSDFEDFEVFKMPDNFEANNANILELNSVDIIICKPSIAHKRILSKYLYVKALVFENKVDFVSFKNRQKAYHKNKGRNKNFPTHKFEFMSAKNQEWKELVGTNLSQMYQYRSDRTLNKEYYKEFEFLVPEEYRKDVEKIRRIAMPSILELLQIGTGEADNKTDNSQLIYKGFNSFPEIKENKFQTLSYQHRMEKGIADISKEHFYSNENLKTANTVNDRNNIIDWYKPNEKKVIWVTNNYQNKKKGTDNKSKKHSKTEEDNKIINPVEVNQIESELKNFIEQAKNHPTKNNSKYEIAVLSFYNDQVTQLRNMLQSLYLPDHSKEDKFFVINNVAITLSTVDKFQGDEADMVLLSFTKATKKAHYNSPNRLNVALTRARFKLILYGNHEKLAESAQLEALRVIANTIDNRLNR